MLGLCVSASLGSSSRILAHTARNFTVYIAGTTVRLMYPPAAIPSVHLVVNLCILMHVGMNLWRSKRKPTGMLYPIFIIMRGLYWHIFRDFAYVLLGVRRSQAQNAMWQALRSCCFLSKNSDTRILTTSHLQRILAMLIHSRCFTTLGARAKARQTGGWSSLMRKQVKLCAHWRRRAEAQNKLMKNYPDIHVQRQLLVFGSLHFISTSYTQGIRIGVPS